MDDISIFLTGCYYWCTSR